MFANIVLKTCSERSSKGFWIVPGAVQGRFWTASGHSWPAWGVPKTALGRHLAIQKPSQARPDASPKQPWAPKPAQDRFFFDFKLIWDGFVWILEDFSSNCIRDHKPLPATTVFVPMPKNDSKSHPVTFQEPKLRPNSSKTWKRPA